MKPINFFVTLVALLQPVFAQPHRRHGHQHEKRDIKVIYKTVIAEPSPEPKIVIVVDQYGVPITTKTEGLPPPVPTNPPASSSTSSTSSSSAPDIIPGIQANYAAPSTTSPSATTPTATPPSSGGYGVTYNQYNTDHSCKTEAQVKTDFNSLGDFPLVRIYGTDCNGPSNVLSACKATGKKLFVGIFSLDNIDGEVTIITDAVKNLGGDWSLIHTVSVCNECVDGGLADVNAVMSAVATVRGKLRAAGYNGPVVTVDTLNAAAANPRLCDESDYCAVNCHPFFEEKPVPSDAGTFLMGKISTLQTALSDKSKKIIITETGWPTSATGLKASIASPSDQTAALNSIKAAFSPNPGGVILFSSFNRKWVTDLGQYNQEPWWGFLGDCPSG